jgi:hypothetical protein
LSKLPSTTKRLKPNTYLLDDPLTALEKAGINPTELMFYNYERRDLFLGEVVTHPEHIDYIKRLGLLKTLVLGFRCSMESLNDNMVFENITHLKIMMVDPKKTCTLDQLFLSYPSLIGLTIHESSSPLTVSGPCTQKTNTNLRKLSIKNELLDLKPSTLFAQHYQTSKSLIYQSMDTIVMIDVCGVSIKAFMINVRVIVIYGLMVVKRHVV